MWDPIATRLLRYHDENGDDRDVFVRIWAPVRFGGDYVCDYEIAGLPDLVRNYAMGVDSFQAMSLAMVAVRAHADLYGDRLSWLDGEPGDHQLPKFINFYDSKKRRKLERLIDEKIENYIEKQLEPHHRRMRKLRERYDEKKRPQEDLASLGIEQLIERIRAASERSCASAADGDRDGETYFILKQLPYFSELKKRDGQREALEDLASAGDRPLRLRAAQWLSPFEAAMLVKLRDESVEPEASAAANLLSDLERSAGRRRPWD